MSAVVKRSISIPTGTFDALEQIARADGTTVSAVLTAAAELWMLRRRGLDAVAEFERLHGGFTAEELAAADAELDRVGLPGSSVR